MIKSILEALLGGTMEKMLKSNSGLTALNTFLLLGCLWISYQNFQDNKQNSMAIHDIKAALYYERHIKLPPLDDKHDESRNNVSQADVILSDNRVSGHKQENN